MKNQQLVLAERPEGIPGPQHFSNVTTDIELTPPEGQIAVKNLFLSIDPAMRGWVSLEENYLPPVGIGEVMRSVAVAKVVATNHPDYTEGDYVYGMFGWQEYCITDAAMMVRKLNPELAPVSTALGVIGPNGLTAYFALFENGEIKKGDTVVISTAAGGVGSIAGQIAKLTGCTVIGLTGSDEKVAMCTEEFGYDHALNYKTCDDLEAAIKELAPNGVNVFFDNTSGAIADAVYPTLAMHARAIQVGTAAIDTWLPVPTGPRRDRYILTKRLKVSGFVILDHYGKFPEALTQLATWYNQGQLNYKESITYGLENAPTALAQLYEGVNLGKQLILVAEDNE
jgi:NADPH-dependent curcumin reductase CurA